LQLKRSLENHLLPPFAFNMEINGETRHFNNTLNLTAVIPEPDAAWLPPDRECGDPERPESEAELIAVPLLAWQALLHLQEVAARVATPRLAVGSSAVAGSCAKRSGSSRLHGVKKLYTHWPPIAGHGAGDCRKNPDGTVSCARALRRSPIGMFIAIRSIDPAIRPINP
jgi:hypothetical protein